MLCNDLDVSGIETLHTVYKYYIYLHIKNKLDLMRDARVTCAKSLHVQPTRRFLLTLIRYIVRSVMHIPLQIFSKV